jgi:S-adenosylmethionine:tRNA ribosyltransferase-isomerase
MLTDPKSIHIADFDYELPENRIAQYPLAQRDHSKLLTFKNGQIGQTVFQQLPTLISAGSMMVFNNTKVMHARLVFTKDTGAEIELFVLEPVGDCTEVQSAMHQRGRADWICLIGNAKRWKEGILCMTIPWEHTELEVKAERLEDAEEGKAVIRFHWKPAHLNFAEMLELAGLIPLPPYMRRQAEESDDERYQTVYAREEGAVAAPTAGLHFTPEVLEAIEDKAIDIEYLTLHVGAGTFRPVKAESMADHDMHAEEIYVEKDLILRLMQAPTRVAVGTTSMRTLESLYWLGVNIIEQKLTDPDNLLVNQWDPYELRGDVSVSLALSALVAFLDKYERSFVHARTSLLIAPGYSFRMVDALVTNFHQPKSTLLLLISAFIGEQWKEIYRYALDNDFRFLSYGDSSILWRA